MGYSETSKAYRIYVLGQRHIEVSRDVTFHEEAVFKRSKELPLDTEVEESETPQIQAPVSETSNLDMQMEELDERLDQIDPVEPIEQVDRSLEAPQTKRRPTWCREIMHEAEKHGAPSGTFRESKRPQRFAGYVAQMAQISILQNPPHMKMMLTSKCGKMP